MDIEEREELDYRAFQKLIELKGNKTVPHRTPRFCKYDAYTVLQGKTMAVVELKTREDYHINDFKTFLLSLHKVDELQEAKALNEAQGAFLVAFYPLDNKTVIFDLTDLRAQDMGEKDIKWVYTYRTHYIKEKGKEMQPFVELDLQEGKHKNYSTKIIDQPLEFLLKKAE